MQAPNTKRNMERMEESVAGLDYDQTQHFITNSTWDHEPVYDMVANKADALFDGHEDTCLLLDETSFAKKGKKSVGVARQWSGRQGKTDNCQVAVFGVLALHDEVIPVGAKLYLPKEWTDDPARCQDARVPVEEQAFRTKPALAMEIIDRNIELGTRFNWVAADGGYGNDPKFMAGLDDRQLTFVVDVHKDVRVYDAHPAPYLPSSLSKKGRPRHRLASDQKPVRVDKLVATQPSDAWKVVSLRKSTRGDLNVEALRIPVWIWDGKSEKVREWSLIVTRDPRTGKDIKYSLCNATFKTALARMAYMQRQRYWVEHAFEIAKSTCGLADYQVRSWTAWHHHVAMVHMALMFITQEKRLAPEGCEMLSPNDIRQMLIHFLPQRVIDEDEVFRQMETRHRKRSAAIESSYRTQRQNRNVPK